MKQMKNNKMSNKHNTLDLALVRIHKIVINIFKFLIKYIFFNVPAFASGRVG